VVTTAARRKILNPRILLEGKKRRRRNWGCDPIVSLGLVGGVVQDGFKRIEEG